MPILARVPGQQKPWETNETNYGLQKDPKIYRRGIDMFILGVCQSFGCTAGGNTRPGRALRSGNHIVSFPPSPSP